MSVQRGLPGVIAGLIVIIFSLFKQKNITLKQHYKLLFPIIILSTVIGLNYSSWSNRLLAEQDTLKLVVQGKIDNLPESSIGLRISLWECGLENWIERPLFGHGAGTNKQIIQQCPQPNLKGTALKDFHNTYIEILSAFGVSGLILWLLFYIRCFNSLNQCHQKQTISLSWLNFLYASLTTVIIWNFFDFRMVHTDYRFFWLTLTAIIGSFCLNNKPQYE